MSLVADPCKTAILQGQILAMHSSVAVGLWEDSSVLANRTAGHAWYRAGESRPRSLPCGSRLVGSLLTPLETASRIGKKYTLSGPSQFKELSCCRTCLWRMPMSHPSVSWNILL